MVTVFASPAVLRAPRDASESLELPEISEKPKVPAIRDPHAAAHDRTPLYVRHQTAADLAAWSVARDIGWDRIRPGRNTTPAATLDALRDACLTEAVQLVAVGRLAAVVAEDMDGSVAASIVAGEGAKHFHALRLYLDASGHRPVLTEREVDQSRREALDVELPVDSVECVVGLLLSEHLASGTYRALAGRTEDSVLRDLLRLIAADKVRHARMAADVLEKWVEKDRSLATRISQAAAVLHAYGAQPGRPGSRERSGGSGWPVGHSASVRTLANRLERISKGALSRSRAATVGSSGPGYSSDRL